MSALLDLLLPPLCDGCGVRARPPWCDDCDAVARALRPVEPCPRCAGPAGPGHPCWDPSVPLSGTVALSRWTGPVARTVLHAKLAGRREVLARLGERLAALVAAPVDVVVPVPTVPRRARQRGLDHTVVLARSLAGRLDVPVVRALRAATGAVDRGSLPQRARPTLPTVAFRPTRRLAAVGGLAVLVVDDVVTTGATIAAAVLALQRAAPARCTAAVVARAGAHRLAA